MTTGLVELMVVYHIMPHHTAASPPTSVSGRGGRVAWLSATPRAPSGVVRLVELGWALVEVPADAAGLPARTSANPDARRAAAAADAYLS